MISRRSEWEGYEEGTVAVPNGVDFEVLEGDNAVALRGPFGRGKSSLLHVFGGLDEHDQGRIVLTRFQRSPSLPFLFTWLAGATTLLHGLAPAIRAYRSEHTA